MKRRCGGRHEMESIKHQRRYKDGGKLCYGCNEIRKLDQYYESGTRCIRCCKKKYRERWKKEKQPLW